MNILRLMLVLLPTIFWFSQSLAQTTFSFDAKAKQGKQYQQLAKYQEAHEQFREGYRQARQQQDQQWSSKFLFYQGKTYLLQAEQATGSEREGFANRAIRIFETVVKQLPDSGSSKVNLAEAYALTGQNKEADAWYQSAITQKDDKQTQYRMHYAGFLKERNPREAIKQLQKILEQQPNNVRAHKQLVELYSSPKYASTLKKYLTEQIANGNVLRAQDSVIDVLSKADWSDKDRQRLMPVLALSLATQHLNPREYQRSDFARKLTALSKEQPSLGLCIRELNQTMVSQYRVVYSWWGSSKERAQAMGGLVRSRARYYDQQEKPEVAKSLYNSAVELVRGKDPSAVRDLVDFYSKRGDLRGINQVSRKYEYALFEGKGQAYRKGDVDAIYDYHRTLASIYSFQAEKTGDWGSASKTNSATFQLQRAYATATRSQKIVPDAKLVTNLATSYEVKGNARKANNVRIDAAEMYTSKGNSRAAEKVLKTVKINTLNQSTRNRYNRVITNPSLKESSIKPILLPNGKTSLTPVDNSKVTGGTFKNTVKPVSTYGQSKELSSSLSTDKGTIKSNQISPALKSTTVNQTKSYSNAIQQKAVKNSAATKSTVSKTTVNKSTVTNSAVLKNSVKKNTTQQYKLQKYKNQTQPVKVVSDDEN